jgi:hypothetical protein
MHILQAKCMHIYVITEKNPQQDTALKITQQQQARCTHMYGSLQRKSPQQQFSILEGNMTKEYAVINFMRVARKVSDHHHLVQSPIAVMSSHD